MTLCGLVRTSQAARLEPAAGGEADDSNDSTAAAAPRQGTLADEAHFGRNGWIYCASIEPVTPEEQAAWREGMPAGYDAVSSIRRPREFARALGAMAAEQVRPRCRIVLLRNTVDGQTFCTAHKSQTVYHGPVVYVDDPRRFLQEASSELELSLLLVFTKHAAHRAQREYRFLVWTEDDPEEDVVDLEVSPALVDAMWKPRQEPEGSGFVRAGPKEYSVTEDVGSDGPSGARPHVETLPPFLGAGNPTAVPRPHDVRTQPDESREPATARGAVEALRSAVAASEAGRGKDAAAAAWHAEPLARSLCATIGDGVTGVQVSEDGFVAITFEVRGEGQTEATIAVGPDGACACKIRVGDDVRAVTAPDGKSFERVLEKRLTEMGVVRAGGPARRPDSG